MRIRKLCGSRLGIQRETPEDFMIVSIPTEIYGIIGRSTAGKLRLLIRNRLISGFQSMMKIQISFAFVLEESSHGQVTISSFHLISLKTPEASICVPKNIIFAAVVIGVDRAWSGDETKIYLRQGLMSKKLATFNKNEDDFLVAGHLARYEDEYKADAVFIDFGMEQDCSQPVSRWEESGYLLISAVLLLIISMLISALRCGD